MLQAQSIFTTSSIVIIATAMLFFLIFLYLLIIQLHRRRILHQKEMYDLSKQFEQTLFQSQLEIQEQTFRNISQEIHDNIGQVLSLAKLNLNAVDPSAEKIALTEELLGKAISDLRDLSKSLHPEKIGDIGLVNAVKQELLILEKTTNLKTVLEIDEETNPQQINREKSIIAFRIIQEVLHNVIKHAKAKEVAVAFKTKSDKTVIEIADNGRGFSPEKLNETETGIGLRNMQQRSQQINADFVLHSTPEKGTTVLLTI